MPIRRRPTTRLLTPAGWLGVTLLAAIASALAVLVALKS